jgi:hypothetical protein
MVFTIKPLSVLAFERRFQGKDEKIPMRSALIVDSTHHLLFDSAWFVFQEEIMLEHSEVWEDGEIGLIENSYLENGFGI